MVRTGTLDLRVVKFDDDTMKIITHDINGVNGIKRYDMNIWNV